MAGNSSGILRVLLVAALAAGLWAVAHYHGPRPVVLPATAPASAFSAERAVAALTRVEGPQVPHPASTPANAAERERLLAELKSIGVSARTFTAMGCFGSKRAAVMGCGMVTDVIADVLPGKGKAIVMLAHYDSVPAGPGAADDGSGVAALLETIRALKAGGDRSQHPVIALFTDGEEYGLLGAASYLQNPMFKAQTGFAINVEARGNQGPSRLFQLSPKPSKLIELYARTAPRYAASSLYAEIYRFLPNDTDLSVFLRDGIPSYNFAIADRLPHYHTPLDNLANLSRASVQDHGDNLLGLVRALEVTPYEALDGHDEIYLDVLGRWLPRIAASWAVALSILFLALVGGAGLIAARGASTGQMIRALIIVPAAMLCAGLSGWLFTGIAQLVSGMPDPAYAHPALLRLALALAVGASAVLVSRLAAARLAAGGAWTGFALLGLAVSLYLPGIAPYFLLPLAAGAVLLPLAAWKGFDSVWGQAALWLCAAAALLIWMPLVAQSETVMGLKLHPLFTVPAAIGLALAVPLFAGVPGWRGLAGGLFGLGLLAAVAAGFQAPFSEISPQRLNVNYVADAKTGKTQWAADASAPLPKAMAAAADFSKTPDYPTANAWQTAYLAPAPKLALPMPIASISENRRDGAVRRVTFQLSGHGDMMMLAVPTQLHLLRVAIGGAVRAVPPDWDRQKQAIISCLTRDCAHQRITLDMTETGPFELTLIERSNGAPKEAGALIAARPRWAVQSQFGDGTNLSVPVQVPGL